MLVSNKSTVTFILPEEKPLMEQFIDSIHQVGAEDNWKSESVANHISFTREWSTSFEKEAASRKIVSL